MFVFACCVSCILFGSLLSFSVVICFRHFAVRLLLICHIEVLFFVFHCNQCDVDDDVDDECDVCDVHDDVGG